MLVTGGAGQLAHALVATARDNDYYQMIACPRHQLDILNPQQIFDVLSYYQPHLLINTAAYTRVDQAEQEPMLAHAVNFLGVKNLATVAAQLAIPLIHISTDYVFSGDTSLPYRETDPPSPSNSYGKSKLLGEQVLANLTDQFLILRVSGVFSEFGTNFVKTMLRLLQEKAKVQVVGDQITCPTYAGDIADTIFHISQQPLTGNIYHYCSAPAISWFQFTKAIAEEAKRYCKKSMATVCEVSSHEHQALAKRPPYAVLSCQKIFHDFAISQPSWRETMAKVVNNILNREEVR